MKINIEQKILLKKIIFAIFSFIFIYIYSDYIILLSFVLPLAFRNTKLENDKYKRVKFPSPDDILDQYFLWKIFCIVYYSILLPMFFLGKLENKSLMLSILIFASPFLLIFLHSLIIFYKRLGGERIDIEVKPRKTLFKYEDDEDKF